MAFGRKKDDRDAQTYMKMSPRTVLLYVVIVLFCVIVISPLVIVF